MRALDKLETFQLVQKSFPRILLPVVALLVAGWFLSACGNQPSLYVASRESNDLVTVLRSSGVPFVLCERPAIAVESAPEGAGVLLLADRYPLETLVAPESLLRTADRKTLRLFLEYPGAIGDLSLPQPSQDRLLRGVVTSDFFGPDLPRLRILALNGMHFVAPEGNSLKTHLAAARVAGFDRAVYGLPETTYPLLSEGLLSDFYSGLNSSSAPQITEVPVESQRGRILVAGTGVSHFVRGRFAPQRDWGIFWQRILEWAGARDLPELKWDHPVKPAYGRLTARADDSESVAFARGVDWFLRARIIASPGILDESRRQDDFLVPWEDAPAAGDGSSGSIEAVMSVVNQDGDQPLGTVLRGDCIAETAMALAAGAAILSRDDYAAVSRRLLDFYLLESRATRGARGDLSAGAYGLIAWGISNDAWYKANYGDDNARLMLATLAASALLKEDRWNDVIMRCLLANLRTTGRKGFRTSRIDLEDLARNGWRHYFDASPVNPAPHFEAYLWACYLLAYQKTGFELFRERAESAIRITMDAYPDGLKWTNGLSQEMARMILPLAWLVRVSDTPENRAMLKRALDPLLKLQDTSGAIREFLGDPKNGKYPPPASNEDYGRNEASLIAENGDPVSDLLYTVNFAFLGLNEAARATGDPEIRASCDRLADFLVRIQVSSERYPYLDGGWFRAFDFGRWEFYASNADIGWGAWCIESGWTQGWITAVLGLRQLDVSLWDLAIQPRIEHRFQELRTSMLPGIE